MFGANDATLDRARVGQDHEDASVGERQDAARRTGDGDAPDARAVLDVDDVHPVREAIRNEREKNTAVAHEGDRGNSASPSPRSDRPLARLRRSASSPPGALARAIA